MGTDQLVLFQSEDGKVRLINVSMAPDDKWAVEFRSRDRWARTPTYDFGNALATFNRFQRQCN